MIKEMSLVSFHYYYTSLPTFPEGENYITADLETARNYLRDYVEAVTNPSMFNPIINITEKPILDLILIFPLIGACKYAIPQILFTPIFIITCFWIAYCVSEWCGILIGGLLGGIVTIIVIIIMILTWVFR